MRVSIQQEWLEAVSYLYFGSTLHPLLLRNGVGNNHRLKHRVVDARNGWSWEDSVGTNCINFGGPCFSKSRKEFMYMYCNHHLKANFYYVLHFRNHVCDWVPIPYTLNTFISKSGPFKHHNTKSKIQAVLGNLTWCTVLYAFCLIIDNDEYYMKIWIINVTTFLQHDRKFHKYLPYHPPE